MLEKLGNIGRKFIDVLIILVFVEAVLSTYPVLEEHFGEFFDMFTHVSNIIFVIEIAIRIFFGGKSFWIGKDWTLNWFDLIITLITLVTSTSYFAAMRSLRLLRLLRLLRVFTIFDGLRIIVKSLVRSIPKIGWLVFLWMSLMVIYAVIGCHMYREDYPELFGDFSRATFTMFQLMTLDGWGSDICRTIMEKYPLCWIYFISYISITAFVLLNALTGVMCNSISEENGETEEIKRKLGELVDKVSELQEELKKR